MNDQRDYIETPIYRVPGFTAMFATVTIAILNSVILGLTRRSTLTRKRAS